MGGMKKGLKKFINKFTGKKLCKSIHCAFNAVFFQNRACKCGIYMFILFDHPSNSRRTYRNISVKASRSNVAE